ncbi:hypothetical protein EAH80_06710 [Mycobacterium hodleri]|uniref:Uncharacterized protein n=1 Tax=Mycolicibacterium hodleri TaxID=49897 RepID=A0A502EHE5_9MYCO|nr:hypothetical protein EAH80_06710 [Mycolicibacterium hodleri]
MRAGAAMIALSFSCDLGADTDDRAGTAAAVGADGGVGRGVEVDGVITRTRWVAPLALVVDEEGGTAERRSTPIGLDDNPSLRGILLWLLFFPGDGDAGAVASEDAEAALPVCEAFGDE